MVYVWKCLKCGELHEVERKVKDINVAPDPCKCGSNSFERTISRTNFSLVYGGVAPFHKEEYSSYGRRDKGK
jgi:putative FmdB family regulatory protein